jgi:hypothetical protein
MANSSLLIVVYLVPLIALVHIHFEDNIRVTSPELLVRVTNLALGKWAISA